MLCKKPFRQGLQEFGCGQCNPCRMNRRRLWTHRLLLESQLHEFSCVATLTYAPEHFPADGSLNPRHMQLWLKRLRRVLAPARSVRFFGCGEYGDDTSRPHYHVVVFGLAHLEGELIAGTWGMGNVHLMPLNLETAQYVCGYVVKKMTAKDDPRLEGRHPEFVRMSLRPGIGAGAIPAVADALSDLHGARWISQSGDVPTALAHGRRRLPLGRYLRRKLREELGFDSVGGQLNVQKKQVEELRALSSDKGGIAKVLEEKEKTTKVKIAQLEGRARIYGSKKGSL